MARKIPVRATSPNVMCLVSAPREISLLEANQAANVFLKKLKDKHGEMVLPTESPESFCFDVSLNEEGQITSQLPTLDQIDKARGHWLDNFQIFLRHRC